MTTYIWIFVFIFGLTVNVVQSGGCGGCGYCTRTLPCIHGKCITPDGGEHYSCSCYAGWRSRNCDYVDCSVPSIHCKNNGLCTPINGGLSYTCTCARGWTGNDCSIVDTRNITCQYGGVIHNFGTTFKSTDGCNECVCALNTVQCTDVPACQTTSHNCTYNNVDYNSGDSFPHSDGCNLCQCTILGVICTSKTCTTTTTMVPYTCKWFGRTYHNGDQMPVDGCHTCTCMNGQAVCTANMNCP